MSEAKWVKVENKARLTETGRMVFRDKGKQILLIKTDEAIFAVNNRCPHEGYPLSEGSISSGQESKSCTLTCNWHNWKFDLRKGETIVGGDTLRHYPVRFEEDEIWVDLQDMPQSEVQKKALDNIQGGFQRQEYDRFARELSRLKQAGGTYHQAVVDCINRNYERLEYGMTHAFAAATDWMTLADELEQKGQEDEALAVILEIINHIAEDTLREKLYPYSLEQVTYDQGDLIQAIEKEDEKQAIALVRGAFSAGLTFKDVEPALATAALAHYNDFGHSAIYVLKTGQLIDRLGYGVQEALTFSLIREIIYASREDLIPEFKYYATALKAWQGTGQDTIEAKDFYGLSIKQAMDRMLRSSARIQDVFNAIHETLAWNMLFFNLAHEQSTDHPIAKNVSWLNFTHGLTFANAVRNLCERYPSLWPQGLLQLACFSGRNVYFIDKNQDMTRWTVKDPRSFFDMSYEKIVDHGCPEPIVSSHLVKLLTAVKEDIRGMDDGAYRRLLLSSVNRFLNSPLKRRHSLRTAKQARHFVAAEG